MRIRVLGAGWYGCHIGQALLAAGHDVEVHDCASTIFAGASGANPARLHLGPHYPRSAETRQACRDHSKAFAATYGHLTRGVPVNLYAVARDESLLDFRTYVKVLQGEIEFLTVQEPALYGLANVEGAILVGERHIVISEARQHFTAAMGDCLRLGVASDASEARAFGLTIDCTFCAQDAIGIGRFEPCITVLLQGPTDKAVTVMDGPFPSLYPWNESEGLCSLTSASLTPFSKTCRTWQEARSILDSLRLCDVAARSRAMLDQMAKYYPATRDLYRIAGHKLSIRAQPSSAADARLCEMVQTGPHELRIRAGKIDAVFHAEHLVKEYIRCLPSEALAA